MTLVFWFADAFTSCKTFAYTISFNSKHDWWALLPLAILAYTRINNAYSLDSCDANICSIFHASMQFSNIFAAAQPEKLGLGSSLRSQSAPRSIWSAATLRKWQRMGYESNRFIRVSSPFFLCSVDHRVVGGGGGFRGALHLLWRWFVVNDSFWPNDIFCRAFVALIFHCSSETVIVWRPVNLLSICKTQTKLYFGYMKGIWTKLVLWTKTSQKESYESFESHWFMMIFRSFVLVAWKEEKKKKNREFWM